MDIKEIEISKIKPYKANAKIHTETQVNEVANSIKAFGFKQPIVVDKNYCIIIGHGRYLAAKKLGLEKVPVKVEDRLTEDQVKALRLADNKTNESEWEYMLLAAELDSITEIDMSDFGFEVADDEMKEQNLNDSEEISLNSFSDDKFKYECPNCGFKFNVGEEC